MTKEEIIHRLQYARYRIDDVTYAPDVLKAIDIAIEAVGNTDTDTISRQAAISAICNACGKIDCDQADKCEKLFTTQEAAVKQGEIRPGDVVDRYVDGRLDVRAMFLKEDGDRWTCLFWTGCGYTTLSYPKSQFKRTGRHYEIEPILEGIRNES